MRSLEYISSAGLRVILKAYKAFSGKEGLTIFNVPKTVMEVFEITGFAAYAKAGKHRVTAIAAINSNVLDFLIRFSSFSKAPHYFAFDIRVINSVPPRDSLMSMTMSSPSFLTG